MDLTKLPLFETLRERMAFLSARQTVLAENVANANTPNYRARDVEAPDFAAMAEGEGAGSATLLRVTSPMHIASPGSTGFGIQGGFRIRDMPDAESTPNGNSVVLEDQMMKVSSNQMDYSTATQIYKKALALIRLATSAPR
jgi:flagellar basal-body rod protein FlgB